MIPKSCPKCGVSFEGEAIPVDQQEDHGGETHFSRIIGIIQNDFVRWWRCPDCKWTWIRQLSEKISGFRTFNIIGQS